MLPNAKSRLRTNSSVVLGLRLPYLILKSEIHVIEFKQLIVYLGLVFNSKGTNKDMIDNRVVVFDSPGLAKRFYPEGLVLV